MIVDLRQAGRPQAVAAAAQIQEEESGARVGGQVGSDGGADVLDGGEGGDDEAEGSDDAMRLSAAVLPDRAHGEAVLAHGNGHA